MTQHLRVIMQMKCYKTLTTYYLSAELNIFMLCFMGTKMTAAGLRKERTRANRTPYSISDSPPRVIGRNVNCICFLFSVFFTMQNDLSLLPNHQLWDHSSDAA